VTSVDAGLTKQAGIYLLCIFLCLEYKRCCSWQATLQMSSFEVEMWPLKLTLQLSSYLYLCYYEATAACTW